MTRRLEQQLVPKVSDPTLVVLSGRLEPRPSEALTLLRRAHQAFERFGETADEVCAIDEEPGTLVLYDFVGAEAAAETHDR